MNWIFWVIIGLVAVIPWMYIAARILKQYKKYFVYILKFTLTMIFIAMAAYIAWDIWGGGS